MNSKPYASSGNTLPLPHHGWQKNEWEGGCEDLHLVEGEAGRYYLNYTTWNGHSDTVSVASSRDLVHWTKHGPAFAKAGKIGGRSGVVVSQRVGERLVAAKLDGKYWRYYTHPCALAAAVSEPFTAAPEGQRSTALRTWNEQRAWPAFLSGCFMANMTISTP